MDFFEAQERARKRTGRLVLLFALAVLGTILAGYAAALLVMRSAGDFEQRSRPTDSYSAPAAFRGVYDHQAGGVAGGGAVLGDQVWR